MLSIRRARQGVVVVVMLLLLLAVLLVVVVVMREHLNSLIDSVTVKSFEAGGFLMKQGDDGDYFYIVEQGDAQIFINMPDGSQKMVMECSPGDSFGELALMYNAPRAATIKATSALKCWGIDQDSFKTTLMESTLNQRTRYEAFLVKVPILSELKKLEVSEIADALKPVEYKAGDTVIEQGGEGDNFYIIEQGAVDFIKDGEKMGDATSGGFFGEIALLTQEKRAVAVTCTSDSTLLCLDRKTFVRVMGPLDDVLKRNMDTYKNYKK